MKILLRQNKTCKIISKVLTMRYVIIFMLLFSYPLFSIEITNYNNEYAQITGMYDSEMYGLIIANTTGVFKIDKETKAIEPIQYKGKNFTGQLEHFFEYKDDIYCYRKQGLLYRIGDGKIDSVTTGGIVAHLVIGEKLYLLQSREPRIHVIENDEHAFYSVGDDEGWYLNANLIEINGEAYAYLGMNWTGTRYVIKINDSDLEYIMSPQHSDYNAFKALLTSKIINVNDELWVQGSKGFYKYESEIFTPIDNAYTFDDSYSFILYYENNKIYGISEQGIYIADINTKETNYLTSSLYYRNKMKIMRGHNTIYFLVDNIIYIYDLETEEFNEFQREDNGQIITFIEGVDKNLLIAKDSFIEWYNADKPTIFRVGSVFANEFYAITYDKFNDKIVALGLSGDNYFLQTFDGEFWDIIPIPVTNNYSDMIIIPDINVIADFNGNYYVSIEDYFGVWDGYEWERISYLKDPYNITNPPDENYHVLLIDSLGGLWVSIYLREYSDYMGKYESQNSIIRITNDGYEIIENDVQRNYVGYFIEGICKNDGDIVINSWDDEIYYYSNGEGELFIPDDGDSYAIPNSSRTLCQNSAGDLVIIFGNITGWDYQYGYFTLPGSVSKFDGENWDHDYYTDIVKQNDLQIYQIRVLYDIYGNDYIITPDKLLRIRSEEEIDVYPIEELLLGFFFNITQIGNDIWLTSRINGLYKVVLPSYSTVSEESKSKSILRNEVINNDVIELLVDITDYQIYTVSGKQVGSGVSKSSIDVSQLSAGIYFIVCETYNKTIVQKFMIMK